MLLICNEDGEYQHMPEGRGYITFNDDVLYQVYQVVYTSLTEIAYGGYFKERFNVV